MLTTLTDRRRCRIRARFNDAHEMRDALGALGRQLGEHHVIVSPGQGFLEIEVDEADTATGAVIVLRDHDCELELLDFESRRIV